MRAWTSLGLALWMAGCGVGNGEIASETRELGEIHALEATQGIRVTVEYGEPAMVSVRTDENLLSMVETRESGGKLRVGIAHGQWAFSTGAVSVTVVTPRLDAVEATSSASVRLGGAVQPELQAKATSGARIELLGLQVDRLVAESTSDATLIAKGSADLFQASSTSGSNISAAELQAREVILDATSMSRASVTATSIVRGEVDSGASVVVRGHPETIALDIESGGAVRYED